MPCEDLYEEEWRPVVGWDNRYDVSNLGRVRRSWLNGASVLSQRSLRSAKPYVLLYKASRVARRPVDRLVIEAFVGFWDASFVIQHVDGDSRNCQLANLRYTAKNAIPPTAPTRLRRAGLQGAANPNAKLTADEVRAIRGAPAQFGLISRLARRYGVMPATISKIRSGDSWAHIPPA
jgi:hypothetical protein